MFLIELSQLLYKLQQYKLSDLDNDIHQFITGGNFNTVFENDDKLLEFCQGHNLIDIMFN